MKQILTAAVMLVLVPFLGLSQELSKDFTVTVGTPYEVIDAGSKEYIALDDNFAIMAKMGNGIVNLQKYDFNRMKEVSRNTYQDLPKKAVFQDIIKIKDQVFYIYEAYDKKAKSFTVYSRQINTEDASFQKPVELFKTSRKVANSPSTGELSRVSPTNNPFKVGGNKFLVYQSFDKSKTMISYRCTPVNKDANVNHDIIGFYVFDEDMNKIWGDEVEMPYTEKQMNNIAYTVGSNGDAKMLITNRETSKYELVTVSGGKLSTTDLNLSAEQLVRNMKFAEDDKGNFVCGGFYANGYEFKMTFGGAAMTFNANGILYFEIDSEGKVTKQKNFDFEEDFIKQNLNDRQKKAVEEREAKGKAGILDLFLTHFMVKEDGSIYIVGERQYARNEFYGPQQKMVYHFSNVIAAKLNPEGELEWMKKLPKNQAGLQGGGQMSIAYLDGKAADYVAFVDNPKNINLSAEDGIPAAHKDGLGGFLTTYKIDHEDGELEKHTILDLEKVGEYKADQFKVWRIFKAKEGTFLMEVYIKGKKDTMVKFEMNQ